jgi:alpha-D-ribose 1-methylphosphonate 5-triphosphate synthase subunit PhnH
MSDSYQSAVIVTPHASNPNQYRALTLIGTGTTPSATVKPKGGPSVVLPAIQNEAIHYPVEVDLVTAATNTTVVGYN